MGSAHSATEARARQFSDRSIKLALIDDSDARAVMLACKVDLAKLREHVAAYLDTELTPLIIGDNSEPRPTAGFQRTIQRAVIHVQSSGRQEVTGANVLVAIFSEHESHAAYFLNEQEMTRYDACNYLSYGIVKTPAPKSVQCVEQKKGALSEFSDEEIAAEYHRRFGGSPL